MSSVVRPQGPLPPRVYWRRRIVVLAILVAIIVVLVLIFIPRGGETPAPTGSDEPSTSEAGGITPTPAPTGDGTCDSSRVELTAVTDKTEYGQGELPQLWFTLENKSSQPCTIMVGGDLATYAMTSPSGEGDETYWTTADCSKSEEVVPVPLVLEPGVPVPSDQIAWPRTRSTPGDCAAIEPQVGAEGASFDFVVALDGQTAVKRIYLY